MAPDDSAIVFLSSFECMTDHLRTERRDYRVINFQECPDKFRTASRESRRLKKLQLVGMDAGFRYKLLSTRSPQDECELILVLEERNGEKTEMKRLSGPPAAVRHTAKVFVEGLGDSYGIEFDEFDFSDIKSSEEFERRVEKLEWSSKSL